MKKYYKPVVESNSKLAGALPGILSGLAQGAAVGVGAALGKSLFKVNPHIIKTQVLQQNLAQVH